MTKKSKKSKPSKPRIQTARLEAALKDPRWKPGKVYSKTLPGSDGEDHLLTLTCKRDGFYIGGKRYDTPTSATQAFCVGILGWSPKARRPPAALFGIWKSPNADKPKKATKKPIKKSARKHGKKPIKKSAKPSAVAAARAADPTDPRD